MKKVFAVVCMVFVACAIICYNVFAQRSVNSADDAAKAARASLVNRPTHASSQIDWLNQTINVINLDGFASKDSSTEKNKSDRLKSDKN